MKRAIVKPVILKPAVSTKKPVRLCTRPGCGNSLTPHQQKYCSKICSNKVNSPGNAGGPPEKYKPEFATTVFEEFLKICEEGHEPDMVPTQSSYIVREKARLPTRERYAEYIGIRALATLDNWCEKYTEFAYAMDRLTRIQKSYLLDNGLSGRYNPQITKLVLGVNHGMIEKTQVDNTHKMIGIVKHLYARADEIEKQKYGNKSS